MSSVQPCHQYVQIVDLFVICMVHGVYFILQVKDINFILNCIKYKGGGGVNFVLLKTRYKWHKIH